MYNDWLISRAPLPFLHLSNEIDKPRPILWHPLLRPAHVLELLHWQRRAILEGWFVEVGGGDASKMRANLV